MSQTNKNKKDSASVINETPSSAGKNAVIKEIFRQEILPPRLKMPQISSKVFIFYLLMSVIAGFLAGFIQDVWFNPYAVSPVSLTNQFKEAKEPLDLNFLLKQEDTAYTKT